MSSGYRIQIYKDIGATKRISLTPFVRTLWEHGLSFAPSLLPQPLTWEQTSQEPSVLYHQQALHSLPLTEAIHLLERDGGSLDLYDKQVPYNCRIEWITSPAQHPVLSVAFGLSARWPTRVAGVGWHATVGSETCLLAGYQQGIASFIHWSAVCCQWFQPELAVSYEGEGGEFIPPKSLVTHLDAQTFPAWGSLEWGWLMYLPTHHVTPDLLTTFLKTPFLTMRPLPPVGLLVYQLPANYRYETRAGNALIAEAQVRLDSSQFTEEDRGNVVSVWQAEAMAYQRAIILFQSAQDAGGESLARLRIQQIGDTIEQFQNRPLYEETPERRDRLEHLRRAAGENGQTGNER